MSVGRENRNRKRDSDKPYRPSQVKTSCCCKLILIMLRCFILLLIYYFVDINGFCWWTRCCLDSNLAINGLESNLSSTLFGQHLVVEPIVTAISSHLKHNPRKALVLSFHGPAGVGKTFVAKKIAHHVLNGDLYHFKFYSGTNDFAETTQIAQHKQMLSREIEETVRACAHSVFIFDEANKMSDGLFDILKPFTDFYEEYRGVDYRRAIFIFISNIGASELSDIYYNSQLKREQLTMKHFDDVLAMKLYNNAGGFKESMMVVNFLVDYYVPFLPLEKEHIEQCIKIALSDNGVQPTTSRISLIYDVLPKKKKGSIEYVPSNCKRVGTEVGRFIAISERQGQLRRMKDEM